MEQAEKNRIIMFRVILILYICLLIRFIVLKYPTQMLGSIMGEWESAGILEKIRIGVQASNLVPFKAIRMYMQYYKKINGFTNLIGNVCAFIPLGILFCAAIPQHAKKALPVLYCALFSLAIELFQLVTLFGIFDVDDIILNTFGGFLGYLIFLFIRKAWVHLKGV